MKKKSNKPLTNKAGEVRELTREDIKLFRPAAEMLPELFGKQAAEVMLKRCPGQRGPQKTPTKIMVSVRLDPAIIDYFKKGGSGWQSRMNDTLLNAID